MPNVNLIEEEDDTEGTYTSGPTPYSRKKSSGGGLMRMVLILFILVVLVGGVFLLNKFGIVSLWGKKSAPVVAQVEQQPFPVEQYPEINFDVQADSVAETGGIEFIETPLIEEAGKAAIKAAPTPAPKRRSTPAPKAPAKTETITGARSTVAQMSGNYTVQVAAHKDKRVAETQVKRLNEAGYLAYVQLRQHKNGTWFGVRIGRYNSINEAKKAAQAFAFELRTNYWIDKYRQ